MRDKEENKTVLWVCGLGRYVCSAYIDHFQDEWCRRQAECIHIVCCTSSHPPYLYDLQSFKLLAERGGRHWLESMALQLLWWILSSPPACQTPWDIIVLSHSYRPGLGFILLTDTLWIKQAPVCSEKTLMIWPHCLHELILLLFMTDITWFILNVCALVCICV